MSAITKKFNKSEYGVIVPYNSGHYEAYIAPDNDEGGVTVHYHKASEAMPAFESDHFDSIEEADEYITSNLKGLDLRAVKKFNAEEEW